MPHEAVEGGFNAEISASWRRVTDRQPAWHSSDMVNAHIHADATYRIIRLDDEGSFGVEVIIAGMNPAMMVPFATKAAADNWIVEHKSRRSSISRG
jgi:hypothetical protein